MLTSGVIPNKALAKPCMLSGICTWLSRADCGCAVVCASRANPAEIKVSKNNARNAIIITDFFIVCLACLSFYSLSWLKILKYMNAAAKNTNIMLKIMPNVKLAEFVVFVMFIACPVKFNTDSTFSIKIGERI